MTVAVLGAGPHGREVAHVLRSYGRVELFDDHLEGYLPITIGDGRPHVIGAAWPQVRRQIAAKTSGPLWQQGIVLFNGAIVSPAASLGDHCHIGYNAVISHGCRLGKFVTICAGVALGGDVIVEDGVFIGLNASILHGGITIGAGATVGAGAVVTRDVRPGSTVVGSPAAEKLSPSWT